MERLLKGGNPLAVSHVDIAHIVISLVIVGVLMLGTVVHGHGPFLLDEVDVKGVDGVNGLEVELLFVFGGKVHLADALP